MGATVTLMSPTQVTPPLTPVSVPSIIRADFNISLAGAQGNSATATVLATTDGIDWVRLLTLNIGPYGPTSVTEGLRFPSNYVMFDALLNASSPNAGNVTVTMTY